MQIHARPKSTGIDSVILLSSLTFVVATLISELLAYATGELSAFRDLPRATPDQLFFDLKIWTFNLADCAIPLSTYSPQTSCTSHLYPFAYPVYPLYILRLLPLASTAHINFGVILGCISIFSTAALFYLTYLRNKSRKLAVVLAFTAPFCMLSLPFRYLLERGQIDQVVLFLLIVPLLLAGLVTAPKQLEGIQLIASVCYAVGALVKIYPIIAFGSNAAFGLITNLKISMSGENDGNSRPKTIFRFILTMITISVLCALLYEPYIHAKASLYPNLGGHGYGLNNLVNAPYSRSWGLNKISKLFIFVASALLSSFYLGGMRAQLPTQTIAPLPHVTNTTDQFNLNACAVTTVTYLFSDSINYKLSLIIVVIPYLTSFTISRSANARILASLLLVCGTLSLSLAGYPQFDPTFYLYKEWIVQFFMHPVFFGGLTGLLCSKVSQLLVYRT